MLTVEAPRDPLVPRPIDLPTGVPLEGPLDALDTAKILAAPDDPADWPVWRERLRRWRDEARARTSYDGTAYERLAWTQRCFAVALVWLWDELLYDHAAARFTPERFCAHAEREFGGLDGVVLWHAYPVIGIDERNQFDYYRDAPALPELVADLCDRGIRVFLDYNPWDVGTRREPEGDEAVLGSLVRELGADGVFLDTMREAQPDLLAAVGPEVALEGESTVPLERIADHHLSWAQWFADSRVPGVLRAKWFEQRHMLHHTRRWNRSHLEELHSAWLNGVGMLVWENVFGAWVGWSERDKELLRAMLPVQRRYADLLATGEWTPLAAASPDTRVVASRWSDGETTLWTLANRGEPYAGPVGELEVELPAGGIAAFLGSEPLVVAGGNDAEFPARETARVPAPIARADAVPEGFVEVERAPRLTAIFRRRETGTYGQAPYVEEWKPLPPSPARLRRGAARHGGGAAVRDRAARGVGRGRRAAHRIDARGGARVCGRARREAPDRGRVAARGRGRPAGAPPPARLELDRERALGRPHALRDPQGRLRLASRGQRLVRRGRQAGAGVLAEAPAGGASPGIVEHRLSACGGPRTSLRRRSSRGLRSQSGSVETTPVRPLDGIRVVEAATLFAAPYAGMLLGDYGADVIKIEHPAIPDPARGHGPAKDGEGLWFKTLARNKRLITLDLSKPDGAELFLGLARRSDVVLENFRPGTLERWGLGWDELSAVNPRLVLARVSGFGQMGPYATRPGFGSLAEAMSGFAALNGEPDGPPLLPPFALADGVAGLATAFAVLAALRAREQSGAGQVIDTSLVEPLLGLLGPQVTAWELLGELQPRTGNRSSNNAPRNVYRTADGSWVAVSASATSIAERVLRLVGRPELVAAEWFGTGAGRAAHVEEIDAAVASWIAARPRAEVLEAFEAAEAAIAPIYDARDIAADPQLHAIGSIVEVEDEVLGPIEMTNVISRLSETPGEIRFAGGRHGADTDDVLAELGLDAAEVERLRVEGIV